jgi:hypothetical protein
MPIVTPIRIKAGCLMQADAQHPTASIFGPTLSSLLSWLKNAYLEDLRGCLSVAMVILNWIMGFKVIGFAYSFKVAKACVVAITLPLSA